MEPSPRNPIRTAADAAELLAPLFAAAKGERIAVLYLGTGRAALGVSEHAGTRAEAELPVRAVVAEALRLGAEALVLAHNHPSGEAEPSQEDLAAGRAFAATLGGLGIRLLDHLIFAAGSAISLRERGLL